ncbi:hypothetical protein B0J17DRAFT_60581 [Rhizoctonia solani]|nr:hypothetical protein B0J17DRAFT_60581 [Rhizoctonia solani]
MQASVRSQWAFTINTYGCIYDRHKKCDQGRPACQRCIRGEFECLGYGHIRQQNISELGSITSQYGVIGDSFQALTHVNGKNTDLRHNNQVSCILFRSVHIECNSSARSYQSTPTYDLRTTRYMNSPNSPITALLGILPRPMIY